NPWGKPRTRLPGVRARDAVPPSVKAADRRLTGSAVIDEPLQEALHYLLRDHVQSWYYTRVSDDQRFLQELWSGAQHVVAAVTHRSKRTDWVAYLTTRLVDDFASHLRIYRKSQARIRESVARDEPRPPLVSVFFDTELEVEYGAVCRDRICLSGQHEKEYLQAVSELLLYLLLPAADFQSRPFMLLARELLANRVLLPIVDLLSDPDYVNQNLIYFTKEPSLTPDTFITALQMSGSCEELEAIRAMVASEIALQRSKDSRDDDADIKEQLQSLLFVKKTCESKIKRLQDGDETDSIGLPTHLDLNRLLVPGLRLFNLSLEMVLGNSVALSYFIDFMSSLGAQQYIFFYLTVEGYRVTAEQQLSAAHLRRMAQPGAPASTGGGTQLGEAARNIYDQYLSEKSTQKLKVDEHVVRKVWTSLGREPLTEYLFDEVQARVYDALQEDRFFPAFRRSQIYVKLLAELDLLKDAGNKSDDEDDSSSRGSSLRGSTEDLTLLCDQVDSASLSSLDATITASADMPFTAYITQAGIVKLGKKPYAVYSIAVTCYEPKEDSWNVYRRYSDFYDLHMNIYERHPPLNGLALPGKKTFNNLDKDFLEKRRKDLNRYLQALLCPDMLRANPGLLELVSQFLEQGSYEKCKGELARKVDTIVKPLKKSVKSVSRAVTAVPENIYGGVRTVSGGLGRMSGNMKDGLTRMLNMRASGVPGVRPGQFYDSCRVAASIDAECDDNIPLRILLLLMDEVFDLQSRNQWLRRRIVAFAHQLVKATFGDMINRRIVEYVGWMTGADQVARAVRAARDAFWTNGAPVEAAPPRDAAAKMRTRVIARARLLGSMPDELRALVGNETTKHGVERVFDIFQVRELNRRLVYTLLEGLLETLFPDNKFQEIFRKIHGESPRVKAKQQQQQQPQ
ncbi:PREDICTED: sorting nexin-13-like, partial [Priapulus caudatus]|uniref:Sorting nexin-13-like n=1 Tax=Priapulus caudatus TaxID=37621 RepID=A0ABM1EZC9_PRICU